MNRLDKIKKEMKMGEKPSWGDLVWLIETIEDQQEELDSWREEGMI